jgi:hypothetical protein
MLNVFLTNRSAPVPGAATCKPAGRWKFPATVAGPHCCGRGRPHSGAEGKIKKRGGPKPSALFCWLKSVEGTRSQASCQAFVPYFLSTFLSTRYVTTPETIAVLNTSMIATSGQRNSVGPISQAKQAPNVKPTRPKQSRQDEPATCGRKGLEEVQPDKAETRFLSTD